MVGMFIVVVGIPCLIVIAVELIHTVFLVIRSSIRSRKRAKSEYQFSMPKEKKSAAEIKNERKRDAKRLGKRWSRDEAWRDETVDEIHRQLKDEGIESFSKTTIRTKLQSDWNKGEGIDPKRTVEYFTKKRIAEKAKAPESE